MFRYIPVVRPVEHRHSVTNEFGLYSFGEWNTNGFLSVTNPYNTMFKKHVIKLLDLNIVILVEIHCLRDEVLEIEGYKVIQFNRQNISKNAIRGSGGIAILISSKILNTHKIQGIYKGNDGQLGVKLTENESGF